MTRFQDWPLRFKLMATSAVLVSGITLTMLGAFSLSIRQLHHQAIPVQRSILNLKAQSYDYLSEIREYVLTIEPETLAEIEELKEEFGETFNAYLQVRGNSPDSIGIARRLKQQIDLLTYLGEQTVAARDRVQDEVGEAGEPHRPAIDLRKDLEVALEQIEAQEQQLGRELDEASVQAEEELATAHRNLIFFVAASGLFGLLFAALVAIWLSKRIARPAELLRDAAQRFADGDFETRAPVQSNDEMGQLCTSFNQLAAEVERLVSELRESLHRLQKSQGQLVQSGKMAAVGELAAGVAHELNNPLSVVLTYSVLLQESCEKKNAEEALTSLPERLELIRTSAERCRTIIDGLLQFSRQEDDRFSPVPLADVVHRTFDLVEAQLRRHRIQHHFEFPADLPPLQANANQLQQVFTNLALNAMQAMDSGGELRIAASANHESSLCMIKVSDTGQGIPPDHLEKIFEPFFTTKSNGAGTGLGLSIVYGIVQNHGGKIFADSRVGQGTTFRLQLPLAPTSGPPQ